MYFQMNVKKYNFIMKKIDREGWRGQARKKKGTMSSKRLDAVQYPWLRHIYGEKKKITLLFSN